MKRNAREREREFHFNSVFESDTGGLLRLMQPVLRRIARRVRTNVCFSLTNNFFSDFSMLTVKYLMKTMRVMTTTMTMMKTMKKAAHDVLDISTHLTVLHRNRSQI